MLKRKNACDKSRKRTKKQRDTHPRERLSVFFSPQGSDANPILISSSDDEANKPQKANKVHGKKLERKRQIDVSYHIC